MTSTGVVRQQPSNSVLQRGKGRAGERGLNRSVVQTNLLLEPEEHKVVVLKAVLVLVTTGDFGTTLVVVLVVLETVV